MIDLKDLPNLHLAKGLSQLTSRILNWDDCELVLAFRKSIFLELPEQFRLLDSKTDDIESAELKWAQTYLRSPGVTIGVFCHAKLIGFASVLLPDSASDGDEASRLLGLSDFDIVRSAQLASCMVEPEFRGLRLQAKLLAWRKDLAIRMGRELLISMTACGNVYSLRNMLSLGMSIQWVGELRPTRWWQVLMLDTRARRASDGQFQYRHRVCVEAENYTKQANLIAHGFEGIVLMSQLDPKGAAQHHFEFARRVVEART